MKDDLYEIGNRLYDHESDPPDDGWKKIAAAIKSPKPTATSGWRNKRLWVPLALIIGVSLYFILPQKQEQGAVISESVYADTVNETHALTPIYEHKSSREKISTLPSVNKAREQNFDPRVSASSQNRTTTIPQDATHNNATEFLELAASSVETGDGLHASTVDESATQRDITNVPPTVERGLQEKKDVDGVQLIAIRDSAAIHPVANESPEAHEKRKENENEIREPAWRINFSFTPNYVARSLKPIANDEVFVTKMQSDDGSLRQRIAWGFAIGAGKAITKDLYIDAHLTFSQAKQNTLFSYSTGNVDTLLAVQQPDQSVRLIPVYTESHREMKSRYTYGGLRIAATYYFLSAPRGRFNLLTAAGINYLLSAEVSERVDGRWIALPDNDLNKLNYTFTVGAGYSMDLDKRWALMINPVLTYNLRQAKSGDLPYRLNQRPFGVNIMLSRRLGNL